MLKCMQKYLMVLAIVCTAGLAGCLPDEKDPSTSAAGSSSQTAEYYASALGNIALKIQNAVVGTSTWFKATQAQNLDLAAMGIDTTSLSAPVKSSICPTGAGTEVLQFTWFDNRDSQNRFTLKGIGADTGKMLGAMRARVASDQVATYRGGSSLELATGNLLPIPASCSGLSMPIGAPVIAFKISRPAAPTQELARTEYRTKECGNDALGNPRRGTLVESRVVTYLPDGRIVPSDSVSGWSTENMGNCVDDVVISMSKTNTLVGSSSAALNNFAAAQQSLVSQLLSQLAMDCVKASLKKDNGQSKAIDTCRNASISANATVSDTAGGDVNDTRILLCEGLNTAAAYRYANPIYGSSTVTWTSGTATLLRDVDNRNTTTSGQQGRRNQWYGSTIACSGNETFHADCANIPGYRPAPAGQASGEKWIYAILPFGFENQSWIAGALGCWIGGCSSQRGLGATVLNSAYFTGAGQSANSGVDAIRGVWANSWSDANIFKPYVSSNPYWTITNNQCVWWERKMWDQCPLSYNPSIQTGWYPSSRPAYQTTLDPGLDGGGTYAPEYYQRFKQAGYLPATATVELKNCSFLKGCSYTWESYGPGTGVFLKSWYYGDTSSVNGGGAAVQTVLLNTEGVYPAYKPVLNGDPHRLDVRQSGYAQPFQCSRAESQGISWPVVVYYLVCGGKGGCWWGAYASATTVNYVVNREYYADANNPGTWSLPIGRYESPYGTWGDINQIPNPIVTYQY